MHDDDDVTTRHQLPAKVTVEQAPAREIVVNGKHFTLHAEQIDHRQLVRLAYPDPADLGSDSTSMTVTYRGGTPAAPSGILAPSEFTQIAHGETFVVTRTDKS